MKILTYLLLLLLLTNISCIKNLEFELEDVQKKVVVNALFNENENWKVILSFSKSVDDSIDQYIENAVVKINSDAEEIVLDYTTDGQYVSLAKPQQGVNYTLTVEVPNFPTITANSSVPAYPECIIQPFDTIWSKYMFANDLIDYDVLPMTVNLPNNKIQFYKIGYYGYQVIINYYITDEGISNLRDKGIPEDVLTELSKLFGKTFTKPYYLSEKINVLLDKYTWQEITSFSETIQEEILGEKAPYENDRFYSVSTFSNCNWLSNISSYTYSIIGINQSSTEADIFLGDPNLAWAMQNNNKKSREYWLMIESCSEEYYQYYNSYALQVSQRLNPYAETIQVYSNINNGLGIFAGYNKQMIHILDY